MATIGNPKQDFDPYSAGAAGLIGLGFEAFGMSSYSDSASQYNQAQTQEIGLEKKANEQRRNFMELDNRRKQLENLRNTQRARSLALNDASNQGAGFGSGLQGGYGQVMGHGAFNQAGLEQSREIGSNLFDISNKQSDAKIQMANAQYGMQSAQGMSSFGGSLLSSAVTIGSII